MSSRSIRHLPKPPWRYPRSALHPDIRRGEGGLGVSTACGCHRLRVDLARRVRDCNCLACLRAWLPRYGSPARYRQVRRGREMRLRVVTPP